MKPREEKRIVDLANEGASEWKAVASLLSEGDVARSLTEEHLPPLRTLGRAAKPSVSKGALYLCGVLIVGIVCAFFLNRETKSVPPAASLPLVTVPILESKAPEIWPEKEVVHPPVVKVKTRKPTPRAMVEENVEEEAPAVSEALLLAQAMRQLKQEKQPTQALETLKMYFQQFPNGELASEANITRIEALAAAGEFEKALQLLEKTPLFGIPREREFRLLRIQLEARTLRCEEARLHLSEQQRLQGNWSADIESLGSEVLRCR